MYNSFGYWLCNIKFAPTLILRGGAVVANLNGDIKYCGIQVMVG